MDVFLKKGGVHLQNGLSSSILHQGDCYGCVGCRSREYDSNRDRELDWMFYDVYVNNMHYHSRVQQELVDAVTCSFRTKYSIYELLRQH